MLYYYLSFYFVLAPVHMHTHTQTIPTHTHVHTVRRRLLPEISCWHPPRHASLALMFVMICPPLCSKTWRHCEMLRMCYPIFRLSAVLLSLFFLISGANLLDQLSSLPPLPLCACVRVWMWVLAQPGTDIIYNLMHNLSIHPSFSFLLFTDLLVQVSVV